MPLPRLRQVVLAARRLAPVAAELEAALGARDPFHDEGVGHFGLENAVYALGDTFIEVVSPVRDGTAAGRQLDRRGGDGGYMAMFELADATAVRARLDAAGVRVVWDTTHDDIVDLHLHPKDVPGAIVALDVTDPPGSWRWGGPAWTATVPTFGPGGLRGLTVAVPEPHATGSRWAAVLGVDVDTGSDTGSDTDDPLIVLDGGRQRIRFVAADNDAGAGIVAVELGVTGATGPVVVGGVSFDRQPA